MLSTSWVITSTLINLGFSSKCLEKKRKIVITLTWLTSCPSPRYSVCASAITPGVFHSSVILIFIGLLPRGVVKCSQWPHFTYRYRIHNLLLYNQESKCSLKGSLQKHSFCVDLKCVKISNFPVHHQSWLLITPFRGQVEYQQSAGPGDDGWDNCPLEYR